MPRPVASSFLLFALSACGAGSGPAAPKPAAPQPAAHAEPVAHETELLRLTLDPKAEARLGIAVATIGAGTATAMRETSGEIVAPAGSGGLPAGSTTNLAQLATQQVAADGEVARANAQVRLARIALARAEALVREEAGSLRARDEAAAALATAAAAAETARQQRRTLGPPIAALGSQPRLWVRVMVPATEIAALARDRAVQVRALGEDASARWATPISAPPSANAMAGTIDLYYALDNRDRHWRIGQRVAVSLPAAGGPQQGLAVPKAAILRDIYGGEWVYQRTAANTYVRRRIEIASSEGDSALVTRGLTPGDKVVTDGAAELFGTEFGVAH
jgi:membrane fusion protein, multidrug efflux system